MVSLGQSWSDVEGPVRLFLDEASALGREGLEVRLRAHTRITDRPIEGERTPTNGSVEQVIEDLQRLEELGVTEVTLNQTLAGVPFDEQIDSAVAVLEAIRRDEPPFRTPHEESDMTVASQTNETRIDGIPRSFEVERLAPTFGAELTGLDLHAPLSSALVEELRAAVVAHKVVFIRDQGLDEFELRQLGSYFGEPFEHPGVPTLAPTPWINTIDGNYIGSPGMAYHFGGPWRPDPFVFEILQLQVVPTLGGDTVWTDQQAAYEALSPTIQELLGGLRAAYVGDAKRYGDRTLALSPENRVEHPVVLTHPDTGTKNLYLSPSVRELVGLQPEEAEALLPFLFSHATSPAFAVRTRWAPGDLAIWDNRATLHSGVLDFGDQARLGWHVMVTNGWRPE